MINIQRDSAYIDLRYAYMNSNMPKDIIESLERAQAEWCEDICDMTLVFKSLNKEAPLTEKEKQRIINFCKIRMMPYDVKFEEGDEKIRVL